MSSLQARNLVNGEWQGALSSRSGVSINPATAEVIGSFADSAAEDGQAAISAARRAFDRPDWAQNPRLRQMVMLRWAARERQGSRTVAW